MAAEKNFENRVKDYMEKIGAWGFKYPATSEKCKSGIPDLNYCINGKWVSMEVKAPDGSPSALQLYNCKKIRKAGGLSVVLFPSAWEYFKEIIDKINAGLYVDYDEIDIIQK